MPDRDCQYGKRRLESRNWTLGRQRQDLGEGLCPQRSGHTQRSSRRGAGSLRWNGRSRKRKTSPVSKVRSGNNPCLEQREPLPAATEIANRRLFTSFSLIGPCSPVFHKSRDIHPGEIGTLGAYPKLFV